jgi:hypothetical protein
MLQLVRVREELAVGRSTCGRIAFVGTLGGLGYNLDLGLGPVLLAALFGLVAFRCRSWKAIAAFVAGAFPWIGAHHVLNYMIGGTIGPANAVPEYLNWPGSPFDTSNMTGVLRPSAGKLAVYSLALLFGKHGFIAHNLPLYLALPGAVMLLWRRSPVWPEVLFSAFWCTGGWLLYAVFSNNYGGACCSVRWFVPFLAPGFYVLAEAIRQRPDRRWDVAVLASWGAVLGAIMWANGPFIRHMVPMYWPIVGFGLVSWVICRRRLAVLARQRLQVLSPLADNGVDFGQEMPARRAA